MLNTPFSPWPNYSEEEAAAVHDMLLSNKVNYWTGTECLNFEKEFAAWVGSEYAISLANGSVALEIALKALKIGPGDEVIVTPRTFIASAAAIVLVGAQPVFADVDENSQNITAETIQKVLTTRTKAVICVHLAGWPCDMDPIMDLAADHNLFVIEDCAQAHGALYKGRSVGSIGHIGAWSFCQDKIITTGGEGGMVTTNDRALWSLMWSYKDHGKSWDVAFKPSSPSEFRWLHHGFGTNARMLEFQGLLGRIQLKKMSLWHQQRLENAKQIWKVATSLAGLRVPKIPLEIEHAAYRCYVFVNEDQLKEGWSRNRILESIHNHKVPCYYGSCSEIYLEKAFNQQEFNAQKRLPTARQLGETSLAFLVHPNLTAYEIQQTCIVLKQIMGEATQTMTQRKLQEDNLMEVL